LHAAAAKSASSRRDSKRAGDEAEIAERAGSARRLASARGGGYAIEEAGHPVQPAVDDKI
jgi:hypothetical protein